MDIAEMELREPKLVEKWEVVHVTGNNHHGCNMDRSYFTHFISLVMKYVALWRKGEQLLSFILLSI